MGTMIINTIFIMIIFAALAGLGWVTKRMWDKRTGLPGLWHWLVDLVAKAFHRG